MVHGHPLARLAALVAAARAGGRPTRLVLRNTERFGLIHLYFQRGRLTRVEGHRSTALNSLADLTLWQFGVIRQDDVPEVDAAEDVDPRLETALSDVLRQLEARGVVQPAPPARVWPRVEFAEPVVADPLPPLGVADLPPIPTTTPPPGPVPGGPSPVQKDDGEDEHLTEPQWQLIALLVHQVVEQAGALVGQEMTEGMLRQALTHLSRSNVMLATLELDSTGWLRIRPDTSIAQFSAYTVAESIASLLASFEMRCGSLVGSTRAQQIIMTAAAPFRASLAQIGLDISA